MFYYFVRPLARLGTYLFFRKIYFCNEQRIPRNKPVILAINHPTGFMEPIILAVLMRQPLHFLVRGDFFSKKIFDVLLRALHMIPIYRMRDKTGFSGVKNNFSTFESCFLGLKSGKIIMIFPEGRAIHEKRLRPLQKGLIRIAFGTLERFPELEDLYVVPVGANFTNALLSRSEVMINFGEPLRVRDFYRTGSVAEGEGLMASLEKAMAQQIVIVNTPKDDDLVEHLLILDRNLRLDRPFPVLKNNIAPFEREKKIADYVNNLAEADKERLKPRLNAYFQKLDTLKLNDRAVMHAEHKRMDLALLWIVLGFVPAWLGRVFAYLPARLAFYIKHKVVRRLEYKMPVWACASWVFFLLYYILWLLLALISGEWIVFGLALMLGAMAIYGLYHLEWQQQWIKNLRCKRLPDDEQAALIQERHALLPFLKDI